MANIPVTCAILVIGALVAFGIYVTRNPWCLVILALLVPLVYSRKG
jgi:hypothetical protein